MAAAAAIFFFASQFDVFCTMELEADVWTRGWV